MACSKGEIGGFLTVVGGAWVSAGGLGQLCTWGRGALVQGWGLGLLAFVFSGQVWGEAVVGKQN